MLRISKSALLACVLGGMVSALYGLGCEAAGSIPYGSRSGMEVTIIDKTGINTENAVIQVRHTRENARQFCDEYLGDHSESCVTRTLREVRISDAIKGNCPAGRFVNLGGEYLQFAGPNFDHDAVPNRPEYKLYKQGAREFLDGSTASGYAVNLEQFRVLCPDAFFRAEQAFAARPKFIGRWYNDDKKVCHEQEGAAEGLLVYKTREFIGLETNCAIKSARTNGALYEILMSCHGEGMALGTSREILEVKGDKLERTSFEGKKASRNTYTRCPY